MSSKYREQLMLTHHFTLEILDKKKETVTLRVSLISIARYTILYAYKLFL